MRGLLGPIAQLMAGLSWGQRIALTVLVGAVMAGFLWVTFWLRQPDYQLLYGDLPSGEAWRIIEKLREQKIPYRIANGGRDVLVSAEKIYEMRLSLAGEGLPESGQLGFEIFDRSRLGMGRFTQRVFFQRALQGELSRTIGSFESVKQARVHLVMASDSVFENQRSQPSASVVLLFKPGGRMGKDQIQAVVHLVAGSVRGLLPEQVVVVDQEGKLLSGAEKDGDAAILSTSQLDFNRQYEAHLEQRVEKMLERALGPNMAVVRVSADIDFTRMEQVEEQFDPEKLAIRSEQRSSETSQKKSGAGESSQAVQGGAAKGASSKKEQETVNYELNKLTRKWVEPAGKVKRLSVAVLVDGSYKSEGGGEPVYVPRTDEDIKTYENLVRNAVGFNADRGDVVTVVNVPLHHSNQEISSEEGEVVEKMMNRRFWVTTAQKLLGILLIPLLLVFLVLRPLLKWVTSTRQGTGVPTTVPDFPKTVGELEEDMGLLPTPTTETPLRLKAVEIAKSDPVRAAQLARTWIKES